MTLLLLRVRWLLEMLGALGFEPLAWNEEVEG